MCASGKPLRVLSVKPKGLDQEFARRLLDEYCLFWSVEMIGQNESEGSIDLKSGFHASRSTRCKLQQSTIGDMNQSLLG